MIYIIMIAILRINHMRRFEAIGEKAYDNDFFLKHIFCDLYTVNLFYFGASFAAYGYKINIGLYTLSIFLIYAILLSKVFFEKIMIYSILFLMLIGFFVYYDTISVYRIFVNAFIFCILIVRLFFFSQRRSAE